MRNLNIIPQIIENLEKAFKYHGKKYKIEDATCKREHADSINIILKDTSEGIDRVIIWIPQFDGEFDYFGIVLDCNGEYVDSESPENYPTIESTVFDFIEQYEKLVTFEQFQSKRKFTSAHKACEFLGMTKDCIQSEFVFMYDGYFIEILDGEFMVNFTTTSHVDKNLEKVERIFWEGYVKDEMNS